MSRTVKVFLVVVLGTLALASIVSAGLPSGHRVTGGAWFNSFVLPERKLIGGRCQVSLIAQEQDGVWSGRGHFMDMEDLNGVRHVAMLTVNDGIFVEDEPDFLFPEGSVWYYLLGTAEHSEDNTYTGTVGFSLRVVDVGPTPDGVADTLGLRLYELGGSWDNLDDVFYRAGPGAGAGTDYPSFHGMFRIH